MKRLVVAAGLLLAACTSAPPDHAKQAFIVFEAPDEQSIGEAVTVLRHRADAYGVKDADIVRQGDKVRVTLAGPPPIDIRELATKLGRAGSLTFNLVDSAAPEDQYAPGVVKDGRVALRNLANDSVQVVFTEPVIGPRDFASAWRSACDGRPNVEFKLTPEGREKFAAATTEHVGEFFAIVMDGAIVSAPRIVAPVTGGSGQISGTFSPGEADEMAVLIRSGNTLPALKVLEVGVR